MCLGAWWETDLSGARGGRGTSDLPSTGHGSGRRARSASAPRGRGGGRGPGGCLRGSGVPPGPAYHGQRLGRRGGSAGHAVGGEPQDRHLPGGGGLRLLGVPDHRELGVPEAAGRTVLGGAIDELPADYRTAFLLHDVEGLSNPEIAETLHVTLAAIKSRVHRARLFLRKRLADYMGSAEAMPGAVGGSTSGAIHRPLPPLAARLPQGVDRPHRPYQPRESEHSAGEVAVESTTRQLASNEVAVTERTATHTVGAKTWPTSFP
jgi:hypothetical protein